MLLATLCLRRSVLASAMPRVNRSGLAGLLFFWGSATTALVAPETGFRQQAARHVKGYKVVACGIGREAAFSAVVAETGEANRSSMV